MNIVYFLFAIIGMAILILVGLWWASRRVMRGFSDGLMDGMFLATGILLGALLVVTGLAPILGY